MVRRRSTVRFRNVAPSSQMRFEKNPDSLPRPWWGLTVSGRVIARSPRAPPARSRPPRSGDNLAQLMRSRNCSRPRDTGCQACLGRQRHSEVPALCGRLSLDGPIPRRSRSGRSIPRSRPPTPGGGSSWSYRRSTGDGRASTAPSPWWPRVQASQSGREPRPLAASPLAPEAARTRPPPGAAGRRRAPPRPRPRACPGNALQAPAADAAMPGSRSCKHALMPM